MSPSFKGQKQASRVALIAASMTAFLSAFMVSAVNLAIPAISREMGGHPSTLTWISSAYLLASAICLLPFGRMTDSCGPVKVLFAGSILFALAHLVTPVAHSIATLIFFRVVAGVGAAMVVVAGLPLLALVFPPHERRRAFGFYVANTYIGLSLAPWLGGWIIDTWSWRALFWIAAPVALLITALLLWGARAAQNIPCVRRPADYPGILLSGAGLITLLLGFSHFSRPVGWALLIAAALLFPLFVRNENSIEDPLLDMRLFARKGVFVWANLSMLINYSSTFATGYLISLYLQNPCELPARTAGLIMITQPIAQVAATLLTGWISKRTPAWALAMSGMAVTTVALALFTSVGGPLNSPWVVAALLAFMGIGLGLFVAPNTAQIMDAVPQTRAGMASACVSAMRFTGMTASMAICLAVMALLIARSAKLAPEVYPQLILSMRVTFALFACLGLTGTLICLKTRPGKPHTEPGDPS